MAKKVWKRGIELDMERYVKDEAKRKKIRDMTIELLKIKSEVRVKAQELSKKKAEYFGYPYKQKKE